MCHCLLATTSGVPRHPIHDSTFVASACNCCAAPSSPSASPAPQPAPSATQRWASSRLTSWRSAFTVARRLHSAAPRACACMIIAASHRDSTMGATPRGGVGGVRRHAAQEEEEDQDDEGGGVATSSHASSSSADSTTGHKRVAHDRAGRKTEACAPLTANPVRKAFAEAICARAEESAPSATWPAADATPAGCLGCGGGGGGGGSSTVGGGGSSTDAVALWTWHSTALDATSEPSTATACETHGGATLVCCAPHRSSLEASSAARAGGAPSGAMHSVPGEAGDGARHLDGAPSSCVVNPTASARRCAPRDAPASPDTASSDSDRVRSGGAA